MIYNTYVNVSLQPILINKNNIMITENIQLEKLGYWYIEANTVNWEPYISARNAQGELIACNNDALALEHFEQWADYGEPLLSVEDLDF